MTFLACLSVQSPFESFTCQSLFEIKDNVRYLSTDDSDTSVLSKSVLGKIVNQRVFKLSSRENSDDFEADYNCKSVFSVEVEDGESGKTVRECRNGPRNNPQGGLEALERNSPTDACNLLVNDNVADPSEEREIKELAMCGFNVGTKAYCTIQISDDYYREVNMAFYKTVLSKREK